MLELRRTAKIYLFFKYLSQIIAVSSTTKVICLLYRNNKIFKLMA